jgi:hypothetical protein
MRETSSGPSGRKKEHEAPTCTPLSRMGLMERILHIEDLETLAVEDALAALRELRKLKHGVFGVGSGAFNE